MSWESIIGFIVIIAISSIFNKNKRVQPTRRTNTSPIPPQEKAQPKVNPTARPVGQPNKKPFTSLEDMLRDLQRDVTDVFEEAQGKKVQQSNPQERKKEVDVPMEAEGTNPAVVEPQGEINQELVVPNDDYHRSKEISATSRLSFDRDSIIQGIVMSEILGKPKSLQKR